MRSPRQKVAGAIMKIIHRRRWLGVAGALVAGGISMLTWSAVAAYHDVTRSEAEVRFVASHVQDLDSVEGRSSLKTQLHLVARNATEAYSSLSVRVASALVGWMPGLGADVNNVTTLLSDEVVIAHQGTNLIDAYGSFRTAYVMHNKSFVPAFVTFQHSVEVGAHVLDRLPRLQSGWFNPLQAVEAKVEAKIVHVQKLARNGSAALRIAATLLGVGRPSTILVLPANNAEMRDEGAILSYTLFRASNMTLTTLRSGHSSELNLATPAPFPASPGAALYYGGAQPSQIWQSVDVPADFSLVGRTAAAMFDEATGVKVDAIVTIDVPAMARLLAVGGPLSVPDVSQPLNASNFSAVVLHDLYAENPVGSQDPRYNALSQISSALLHRIESDKGHLREYLQALATQIPGRHFLLWAARPSVESSIAALGADGRLESTDPTHTFHVAVENDVASKLDYYLHVSETYVVTLTGNGGADVATSVTLHNEAPTGQAPSYQLGPDGVTSTVPGQYVGNIYQWTPRGSNALGGGADEGLVLSGTSLSVLAGQSGTADFWASVPHAVVNGHLVLRLVPQASLYPAEITIRVLAGTRTVSLVRRQLSATTVLRLPVSN